MDMNQAKTSILEMARGAFTERVDYEMAKIVDNIMVRYTFCDVDTNDVREITQYY